MVRQVAGSHLSQEQMAFLCHCVFRSSFAKPHPKDVGWSKTTLPFKRRAAVKIESGLRFRTHTEFFDYAYYNRDVYEVYRRELGLPDDVPDGYFSKPDTTADVGIPPSLSPPPHLAATVAVSNEPQADPSPPRAVTPDAWNIVPSADDDAEDEFPDPPAYPCVYRYMLFFGIRH